MEAKKHPVLVATLAVLGLASLTGVVLAGLEYAKFSKSASTLALSDRKVDTLLGKESIALTPANVSLAEDNLAKLKAAEAAHRDELTGASPSARFEDASGSKDIDPGVLGSNIKQSIEGWRTATRDAGIKIVAKQDEFAFGFSRYFQTGTNPQKSLREIDRQTRVVDFLVKSLASSKLQSDEVRLVAVEREPVELGVLRVGAQVGRDELTGLSDSIFRREGLLRSEFYRVRFVAKTGVLRRFVNTITDSGRSLSVRGVEAAPAAADLLQDAVSAPAGAEGAATLPAGLFGDATPPPAPDSAGAGVVAETKSDIVIHDAPSDFTVTIELIEPVKTEAAPAEVATK